MKTTTEFKEQLDQLQQLVWVQRSVRLLIRAAWLGVGGVLLGWGMNRLWGILPNPLTWVLAGLLLAAIPLGFIFVAWKAQKQWTWTLDRRLGLREQVSTALTVTEREEHGPVAEGLVEDVTFQLPRLRERVLSRGWFLRRDGVALLIVTLLGICILAATLMAAPPKVADAKASGPLPFTDQGQNPGSAQGSQNISPRNAPGKSSSGEGQGSGEDKQPTSPDSAESQVDNRALVNALGRMGSRLSGQAATFDLGEALKQMDLQTSADELNELANSVDGLSRDTLQKMADAMRDAGQELEGSPQQELSQDLKTAAEALQQKLDGDPQSPTSPALDKLAEDLRKLDEVMQDQETNGPGAGGDLDNGGGGQPEPADRLQGKGENLELPAEPGDESSLLSPSTSGETGDEVAGGSQDSAAEAGGSTVQNYVVPYTYLWKWRDVVSSYFQR